MSLSTRSRRTGPSVPGGDDKQTTTTCLQRFTVNFSYPVHFTRRLFSTGNPLFMETVTRCENDRLHRLVFFIDDGVAAGHPTLHETIDRYLEHHRESLVRLGEPILIPGGERCKNKPDLVEALQAKLMELAVDRQSFVVAIGGGAVLDLVGYVAATVHRGIRLIRLPTTVLSQNDSGVGVKNGVNVHGIKNFLGTFVPPFAVISDFDLLASLDARHKRAGYAEAVKVGLIRDRSFFEWIEANAGALKRFQPDAMAWLIQRCAELHMMHIATSGDPFELGSARPLDFGHWAAHKLESLSQYDLQHGEAVAIGIALDTRYSMEAGLIEASEGLRIISLLEQLGFRLWHPALEFQSPDGHALFLDGQQEFREHLGGELTVPLLAAIGTLINVHQLDTARVLSSSRWLKERDSAGS